MLPSRATRCCRLAVSSLTALAVMMVCGGALAQDDVRAWPAKPVMIIIPFTPGGSTDTEGRLYTQKMSVNLGKSFILDYKPGGATTIGTAHVAKSAPDGYTLLGVTISFSLAVALHKNLPYDPLKDITPLSLMTQRPSVLVVSAHQPMKTIAEYVAYVKAYPDKLNFGSYGVGSGPHVGAVWLHSLLGASVTYVHYKGQAPMQLDLTTGRIDVVNGSFFTNIPLHKTGKVRILAVSTPQRSPQYPEFPTLAESGAPGYDYGSWWGFLGPGRILPALANRISAEMAKACKSPDVTKTMTSDGAIMVLSTPEQFRKDITAEIAQFRKLVADNNIKPEEQACNSACQAAGFLSSNFRFLAPGCDAKRWYGQSAAVVPRQPGGPARATSRENAGCPSPLRFLSAGRCKDTHNFCIETHVSPRALWATTPPCMLAHAQ